MFNLSKHINNQKTTEQSWELRSRGLRPLYARTPYITRAHLTFSIGVHYKIVRNDNLTESTRKRRNRKRSLL